MLWDRSNRFTATKKDEKILTYESFSDYLRHQFLQSRNLFHHYQEYRKSQKQKKYKHDPRKIHHDFQSPHHHEEGITPATSLTEDAPKDDGRNENTFFLTQTNEGGDDIPHTRGPISTQTQPSERQDQIQKSKKKKNNKLILLKSKVLPSYLDNTMPGPGSYHHPESLVKPSFNRVYTEPPPAHSKFDTSKKKTAGLRNYLRPTTAIKKRMESKPLWNGTRENRPILSRSMSAPVTLDNTTHRPGSAKPYAETHKNPYSSAKASLTPDGSPRKKKGNIYGTRYPPVSEKIIRRWISYSHDSYPDYSKPSLLSPHAKTMLSKR